MGVTTRAIRILNKLQMHGADTEKKITALTYPEIMKICKDSKTLAFQDMEMIVKLQEDIKARRVISFMLGTEDDEQDIEKGKKKGKEEGLNAEDDEEKKDYMSGRQLYAGDRNPEGTSGLY